MNPKLYQQVEKIYYQVLDANPDDVNAFVVEKANGGGLLLRKC